MSGASSASALSESRYASGPSSPITAPKRNERWSEMTASSAKCAQAPFGVYLEERMRSNSNAAPPGAPVHTERSRQMWSPSVAISVLEARNPGCRVNSIERMT
jgi:hypothetical protein